MFAETSTPSDQNERQVGVRATARPVVKRNNLVAIDFYVQYEPFIDQVLLKPHARLKWAVVYARLASNGYYAGDALVSMSLVDVTCVN